MPGFPLSDSFAAQSEQNENAEIRIWADGCYDVGHFGHANSLRQAKALGNHLTVGVHSDAEIMKHKGPPLFNEVERYAMIRAIRWVDNVVEDAPYVTQLETLDCQECHFCAHGNDITTDAQGNDTYKIVKDAGRYKEVERTLGVSTTDIINRMLKVGELKVDSNSNDDESNANDSPYTGSKTKFSITSQKIRAFGSGNDIRKCQRVVLAYGCFDVFHPGHINYLKAAKEQGDFLLVGVYDDTGVKDTMGADYPIMTLYERIMSVLACRDVDDVIIGFPLKDWTDILSEYRIAVVVHAPAIVGGSLHVESIESIKPRQSNMKCLSVDFGNPDHNTKFIVDRVNCRRAEFQQRNAKKEKKENEIIAAEITRQKLNVIEVNTKEDQNGTGSEEPQNGISSSS